MCGIVGYLGDQQAYSLLLKGLERLEYRGYDSAGIAVYTNDRIEINKSKGSLEALRLLEPIRGQMGIGHTRWATHGSPTAGLREAKRRGSRVLAITNVQDSSIAREADDVLYTYAGPEIAVASTKAYTTQLVVLSLLAIYLAQLQGNSVNPEIIIQLQQLPVILEKVIDDMQGVIEPLANRLMDSQNMFFIGRGLDYAVAEEGALKLKEISYIHAEAYAAGELKHGTLALIEDGVPVIALALVNKVFDKMVSNIREVKARGATVIALTKGNRETVEQMVDEVIVLPQICDLLAPLVSVIPLQLFAYHTALARGCNVDKPRNLAKSVTVE